VCARSFQTFTNNCVATFTQGNEAFFKSPRLAQLSTRAEVLAQQSARKCQQEQQDDEEKEGEAPAQLLSSWECPICLEALHQPVVLT
jgi:hypothetical protein